MQKKILPVTILLFALYILGLIFSNKINLYIHPRYISLSIIFAVIALVFTMFAIIKSTHYHVQTDKLLYVILLLPLCLAFFIPPKSLSIVTAKQRGLDNSSFVSSPQVNTFIYNADNFDFKDWFNVVYLAKDIEQFLDTEFTLEGFVVYPEYLSTDEYFQISRFVLSCCSVDARPIGIYVRAEDKYTEGEWLSVTGKLELRNISGQSYYVVAPREIEQIEELEDPYLY